MILIPGVWNRLKEWSYVGIGCIYIGALWAHISLDGLANPMTYAPLVTFAVLLVSYCSWHKILKAKGQSL
jgi:DMSO/TMAO reductase YedYZ heme-binding membrane subunit